MFIREYVTVNRKTGVKYITHRLVESYQSPKGPRQRIIMHLGVLDLPKSEWRKLAALLEARLAGQPSLLDEDYPELAVMADQAMDHHRFISQKTAETSERKQGQDIQSVDLNSLGAAEFRSWGPELAGHTVWEKLKFGDILTLCGFSDREIALAKAVVIGRLVEPESDLGTWKWLRHRSGLAEMEPGLARATKNDIYEIADRLLDHKEDIERALWLKEQELFPPEKTLYLYDLTNTYFEGQCIHNEIAYRGHSKEQRMDCPLVTLALVVDYRGFPIFSRIYDGNQPEPGTLEEILTKLKQESGLFADILPTVVMDRGIATTKNMKLLKDNGFPYIVVERRHQEKHYLEIFETGKEEFERMETSRDNVVYVRKEDSQEGCRVLTISEGRKAKEQAIDRLQEGRFLEDLKRLADSVEKGNIGVAAKVSERIGRLKERYPSIAKHYEIRPEIAAEKVSRIDWSLKESRAERETSTGCYVIETSHRELTAPEIWKLYTMLHRVEDAFRDLKSELGMRPIYHQLAVRTMSHLFISVLAYHLLVSIERQLAVNGDTRSWATIRKELATHQRCTVMLTGDDGQIYHIRTSGIPESCHQEIYRMLEVKDPLKTKRHLAGKRL